MGYLPQESSVFQKMTVGENIMAILETMNLRRSERRDRLDALLEELGLKHLVNHKAYTLSGGERRRLEITRALTVEPMLLLLDEPFAGVDPITVDEIQEILRQLKGRGISILITDHNVRETLDITDRSYIINEGKILVCGTYETVVGHPEARRLYLGQRFGQGDSARRVARAVAPILEREPLSDDDYLRHFHADIDDSGSASDDEIDFDIDSLSDRKRPR
jgi:lipopolysaccharide export system ATP-binding protein